MSFIIITYSKTDLILLLLSKGKLKRFKLNEITKGHKNNVSRSYINETGTKNPLSALDLEIIHNDNLNEYLETYFIGEKGLIDADFNNIKSSNPQLPKKYSLTDLGKPKELIIMRNDNDLK